MRGIWNGWSVPHDLPTRHCARVGAGAGGVKYINFSDVGRDKHTWRTPLLAPAGNVDLIEYEATREVRKRGALLSRDVAALLNEDGTTGIVFAGFRAVGRFVIEDDTERAA